MTLEPEALMLAIELGLVCTKSPGKMAEELGTGPLFSQVVPLAYSIAAPEESAAISDNGDSDKINPRRMLRSTAVPFLISTFLEQAKSVYLDHRMPACL